MSEDPRALAARLLAGSRYAMPCADALAHVAARRRKLLAHAPPAHDPDFTAPEQLPILDAPEKYAEEFWKRHPPRHQSSKPKEKKPPGRHSRGREPLGIRHDLRVIDGGLNGDKPGEDR